MFTSYLLTSPFPWVFLAALAFGATLSRLTRPAGESPDRDRARSRKWVLFCVGLSLAVVFGLAALFAAGPERIKDVKLLWLAGVAAGLSFLAFRFRKALGIPVLLLSILLIAATALFLQSLHAFTGETEIAKVRVVSSKDSGMKLELIPTAGQTEMLDMEGQYFAPVVQVVIFNDFWVFLGAKTWYRFLGLTSFKSVTQAGRATYRQGNTDFYFPKPSGISEALYSYFEKNEGKVPGIKSVQVNIDMKRAQDLASYSIRVQNDGGVEIIQL
jgi:hypothetical protein